MHDIRCRHLATANWLQRLKIHHSAVTFLSFVSATLKIISNVEFSSSYTTTTYAAIVLQMEHKVPFHGPIVRCEEPKRQRDCWSVKVHLCISDPPSRLAQSHIEPIIDGSISSFFTVSKRSHRHMRYCLLFHAKQINMQTAPCVPI